MKDVTVGGEFSAFRCASREIAPQYHVLSLYKMEHSPSTGGAKTLEIPVNSSRNTKGDKTDLVLQNDVNI